MFKEKQRTVFGNVQLSEEDKETSEGVSVQWLRGSLPGTSTTHLPPPPPPNIAVPKTPRAVQSLRGSVSASKDRYSVASLRNDTDDSPAGTDDELQTHNTIVKSGLYSTEALEAVGMGLSPGSSSALIPKSASSVPPSPIGLSSATDIVSAKILRAWGLPESLGGTSAYVVADWGKYGKSATQAVAHTTEPHFGATLQFRSPYTALRPADRAAVQEDASIALLRTPGGAEYVSFAGPLKVMVYNRNQSVSDELLACGEVDVHEYLTNSGDNAGETAVLYLVDTNFRPAGCLEYTVKYSMK